MYDYFYIISFDLGRYTGISINQYNLNTKSFKVIQHDTIFMNNYWNIEHDIVKISPRLINIYTFSNLITQKINQYIHKYINTHSNNSKIYFVSEDVFVNIRRIRAYSALLLYITKLEEIVNIKYNSILYKIPPRLIKKIFSNLGSSNKNLMKKIINTKYQELGITKKDIKSMSEHEIDAIAIGYSFIQLLNQYYFKNTNKEVK